MNSEMCIAGSSASDMEIKARKGLFNLFRECPVPDSEILQNLGLFVKRQDLSRIIFMHDLYRRIVDVHGIVVEFGVRWGQNMALFSSFRGMYEPFNHNRKIIGFDTFSGFPSVSKKDGSGSSVQAGAYAVTENYEQYLEKLLNYHEQESPVSQIKKHELLKGDASAMLKKYLLDNPETVVSLAYFDFDLYEPTKNCLEMIRPYLTKGSVIGFDELNVREFPGETIALREVFGTDKVRIERSPLCPQAGFFVFE